jgi:hypothetical protein
LPLLSFHPNPTLTPTLTPTPTRGVSGRVPSRACDAPVRWVRLLGVRVRLG